MQQMESALIRDIHLPVYAFGLDVMIGALCSVLALGLLSWANRMKKGTAPLTAVLSMLCGAICSRLTFCLLNQELGRLMPLRTWLQLTDGGWSMFGLIGGAFFGGWLSARILKENTGKVMDILSCALLPLIIAERLAENLIEDFDISRPLESTFLQGTFLVTSEGEPCLATYYLAAMAAAALLVILLIREFRHPEENGKTAITFLLLFGAGAIVLESLRYDRFLSITFVGLQQIAAAIMLMIGVLIAVKRAKGASKVLRIAALISLPVMVGIVLWIEFRLDRSMINKILLYAGMICTVMVPAVLGLILLKQETKGKANA